MYAAQGFGEGRFSTQPYSWNMEPLCASKSLYQRQSDTSSIAMQMEKRLVAAMSNHFHLLLWAPDAERLARFMQHFQSKLAREINRLTGWRGPVFEQRYPMTLGRLAARS
jgi:hypothetical protein